MRSCPVEVRQSPISAAVRVRIQRPSGQPDKWSSPDFVDTLNYTCVSVSGRYPNAVKGQHIPHPQGQVDSLPLLERADPD